MLVKDLIVELQKLDRELPVYLRDWSEGYNADGILNKIRVEDDWGTTPGRPKRVVFDSE